MFKNLKLKQFDLVEIKWLDTFFSKGWFWTSELDWEKRDKDLVRKSVGYFLKETDQMIAICQSFKIEKDEEEGFEVADTLHIPKVAILDIKKKESKKRRNI